MAEYEIVYSWLFFEMIFFVFGPWLYWKAIKFAMGRGALLLFAYPVGVIASATLDIFCVAPRFVYDGPKNLLWLASVGLHVSFMWVVPSLVAWIIACCLRLRKYYRQGVRLPRVESVGGLHDGTTKCQNRQTHGTSGSPGTWDHP